MIKIGDTVLCRLYNTPERKFYGELFTGRIAATCETHNDDCSDSEKIYLIRRNNLPEIWLHRKEIKRIVK